MLIKLTHKECLFCGVEVKFVCEDWRSFYILAF